ncbi:MAG: stage V sporulation protein AD [Syntrophomonadaceae bacterium]|nr:stage V sporulation protein AD [Syntrophomonadaceae bacterium]
MAVVKKRGMQTVEFRNPPVIASWSSTVGIKEAAGPWGQEFDWVMPDYLLGEKTWEQAESKMMQQTVLNALGKQGLIASDAELLLAGDLLNQIISSNFAARELSIPFLGLYGACSTMAQSMLLGSMLIDGDYFKRVVAAAGSHHYSAERQYRVPVEQGVQPALCSQWTASAAGAVVLQDAGDGPRVTSATVGRVIDLNQKDAANMGAAMAPAFVDTLCIHLADMGRSPDDYDLILSGDLGSVGMELAGEMLVKRGWPEVGFVDCGVMLYQGQTDVNAGGSGCGCSAAILCGPLLKRVAAGEYGRVLLISTGALMSPTSSWQGESIPAVAHAVAIEKP